MRCENVDRVQVKNLAFKLRLGDVCLSVAGSTVSLNAPDVAETGAWWEADSGTLGKQLCMKVLGCCF